jgi:hypothetical protein
MECVYSAGQGETRSLALKRKYSSIETEVDQLRELLNFVHSRPKVEALEIFNRIRLGRDPIEVLRFIKQADVLLPTSPINTSNGDPRLVKLDLDALEDASIKVRARPWTTVAGDGIVSELVSKHFGYTALFCYSVVDQELFLADMENGDLERSRYCSPLLVNAICAFESVSS